MTTDIPDERFVQRRVIAAMERVEEPDRTRLAAIERRLLTRARRPRPQPWWWMVIGLGLAVGAAAAYWSMELRRDASIGEHGEPVPAEVPENAAPGRAQERSGEKRPAGPGDERSEDDGPVIYIGE